MPLLRSVIENWDMTHSRLRKTGFTAALFASSALLVATWVAPAQADGGGGGAFKIAGASYTQELKFANCMRHHGEPDFPDPNSNGVFSLNGIDSNSPQYQRAQEACHKLIPEGHPISPAEQAKLLAKGLAFANCMRRHGVPNFPDPSGSGRGVSFSIRGVNPNSPQFQSAEKTCQKLHPLPGGGLIAP